MITDEQVQEAIDSMTEATTDIHSGNPGLRLIQALVHAMVDRGFSQADAERITSLTYRSFQIDGRDFDGDNALHQRLVSVSADFMTKVFATMKEAGITTPALFVQEPSL